MSTFILAFVFFIVVAVAMSVGYIFQQKSIAGSCGGLGALGIDKACDCPEPCDRKKMRMEKEQAREAKLNEWKKDQIL
ncbi:MULTISPECIES: (Na+)-NQR maturation NqrM [Paraglaciecola]|uniref:(Na+)-NQR maturation NqrM n=1 Tax=Paraglaciecola TaxID=1621534 RepID=UPI00105D65DB|nr:(Na+)-NQR maturation NqrM [Paraglaciecola marina]